MPKENNRQTYTTSIDTDLKDKFKIQCAVTKRNQNEVLEELIREFLVKEGVELERNNS